VKSNLAAVRIYSTEVDKGVGLRCDQTIRLKNDKAAKDYSAKLRWVKYFDEEHKKVLRL
jgi:hypothetical protein